MEWLCNCVRSVGEGSFVLYRKINTEVSSRKMKPCRWSCLWSQEKLAEHLELRISPGRMGWGWGAGPEQQSVWVSPWGPPQRLVYGPASHLLNSSVLGVAATLSTTPPPRVNAKNLLCDSQFCYAEREVIEKIFPENFILNRGGVVAK